MRKFGGVFDPCGAFCEVLLYDRGSTSFVVSLSTLCDRMNARQYPDRREVFLIMEKVGRPKLHTNP